MRKATRSTCLQGFRAQSLLILKAPPYPAGLLLLAWMIDAEPPLRIASAINRDASPVGGDTVVELFQSSWLRVRLRRTSVRRFNRGGLDRDRLVLPHLGCFGGVGIASVERRYRVGARRCPRLMAGGTALRTRPSSVPTAVEDYWSSLLCHPSDRLIHIKISMS